MQYGSSLSTFNALNIFMFEIFTFCMFDVANAPFDWHEIQQILLFLSLVVNFFSSSDKGTSLTPLFKSDTKVIISAPVIPLFTNFYKLFFHYNVHVINAEVT